MSSTSNRPVIIMGHVKRLPSLTPEAFYTYWETVHAPLVLPWILKHGPWHHRLSSGIVRFPVHTPENLHSGLTPGRTMEYDGYGQLTAGNLEDFQKAFHDPYYLDVIAPDERKFIDKSVEIVTVLGLQVDILKDGKNVRSVAGSAGVY